MKIDGIAYRTIWVDDAAKGTVRIIDQTRLPHQFETVLLKNLEDAARAIADMLVRGAPLIGATAAYGLAMAMRDDPTDRALEAARQQLQATRPTAINLKWALDQMLACLTDCPADERRQQAYQKAAALCDQDVATNHAIGVNALPLFEKIKAAKKTAAPLNILTHCNAGWLATVDWGTALAPIYMAHDAGMAVHVWVDETRPRNQGASLTAWELGKHGVPHTVIPDNSGGHLMQQGAVDLCIVGTDRTAANGDVCNKIGTYLKALAAFDNQVPFYVALPYSTIDWTLASGKAIPIEERSAEEVSDITGRTVAGDITKVTILPPGSRAANHAFDVTPARLVTALVTERGICAASTAGLKELYHP